MIEHHCQACQVRSSAELQLNSQELCMLTEGSVVVHFKKGETIIKQNALSLNVAYLRKGMVKVHMDGPSHDKILKLVKAPKYLGLPTSFGEKINQFSVTAIEETSVCFIDLNVFQRLIMSNGLFAYELIVELCRDELVDYRRYASLAQKQVPGLVAETLLCFSEKLFENTSYSLPLNRSEIGDLIGTSRESVSRVLSEMSNENIIKLDSNSVTILNSEALKKISEKG